MPPLKINSALTIPYFDSLRQLIRRYHWSAHYLVSSLPLGQGGDRRNAVVFFGPRKHTYVDKYTNNSRIQPSGTLNAEC